MHSLMTMQEDFSSSDLFMGSNGGSLRKISSHRQCCHSLNDTLKDLVEHHPLEQEGPQALLKQL